MRGPLVKSLIFDLSLSGFRYSYQKLYSGWSCKIKSVRRHFKFPNHREQVCRAINCKIAHTHMQLPRKRLQSYGSERFQMLQIGIGAAELESHHRPVVALLHQGQACGWLVYQDTGTLPLDAVQVKSVQFKGKTFVHNKFYTRFHMNCSYRMK